MAIRPAHRRSYQPHLDFTWEDDGSGAYYDTPHPGPIAQRRELLRTIAFFLAVPLTVVVYSTLMLVTLLGVVEPFVALSAGALFSPITFIFKRVAYFYFQGTDRTA